MIWIALLRSPQFDATDLKALAKGYYGAAIMPVEVLKEKESCSSIRAQRIG